MARLTDA
jgi:hypothetical protein